MRTLGILSFPETRAEAQDWEAPAFYRPLAMKVVAAARGRIEGTWKAYIDAVPGIRHRDEYLEVLRSGTALDEDVARLLFPQFEGVLYAS